MASSGPRILLFGATGAGKSSLLGALAQAAQTQPAVLKGKLVEPTGALVALQEGTYANKRDGAETTAELKSYDLFLEPAEGGAETEATVIDCSGKDVDEMLQSKQPFLDSHPMKKPALNADTVLLVVDASLPGKQLAEVFQQFANWLLQFHKTRGRRTEVGELPVYLVLNKCDLLAKPNDTFSMWMQRIEEGKRRIDQKFREYLKEQGTGFGTLQLRIWATAIKRPALADRPAKNQEPYGVAELFRQAWQSATDYQNRRHTSQVRLHNSLIAMIGLIALLVLAIGFMHAIQPEVRHSSLDEKVQVVLSKKEEDRFRVSLKTLEARRQQLRDILADPDFEELLEPVQQRLTQMDAELEQYLRLYQEAQAFKPPQMTKNEKEYLEQQKSLLAFKVPAAYADDKGWQDSKLLKRVEHLRKEYARVDAEVGKEETWIKGRINDAGKLMVQGSNLFTKLLVLTPEQKTSLLKEVQSWRADYRKQMHLKSRMPRNEYIEGTRVLYEDLEKFHQVKRAQQEWIGRKNQLGRMAENIQDQLGELKSEP